MTPKVFALLAYLVEHRDRLVSKEELLDAVWPGTHVAEGSLARTVTNLRQTLGDEAGEPRFIETVSRRGYRFIAPIEQLADAGESPYYVVHQRRTYRLRLGENILGRAEESVVPIASFAVSRRHAAVDVTAGGATLIDLGSKNGTMVAGRRITEPVPLREGDEIQLGGEVLFFTTRPQTTSTVTRIP